ncbi:MAG TPA: FAD-dependent oxidoreductase [Planctomycetota bacterium]|nr:FAD-dependent oxidoreductase [Planctomycetota bacterium]
MVVILGAGLAGLSAAFHLGRADSLLLEREAEVGGLCRTFRRDGFSFDCTGHLLHLKDPELRRWAHELLPGGWAELRRSAWIASHGTLTPYPFQANTVGLPLDVRLECLLGFIETLRTGPGSSAHAPLPELRPLEPALPFLALAGPAAPDEPSFADWVSATFGAGFARHFFEPYNRKLWQRELSELTSDWVSWSIPRPELADVLRGAITRQDKSFGYNPDFLYPREGGIDRLPRAIAARLPAGVLRTGATIAALDAGRRRVTLEGGETHEGESILSSLPLTALARLTTDLPAALRESARALSHVSVRAVNLGVRGPSPHAGAQWVYVPAADVPFHRVGLPAALSPAMAPPGHHSLTAEISARPGTLPDEKESVERTVAALLALGLLADRADIVHTFVLDIPEAYVVFDRERRRVLPDLLRWYVQRGVVPLGRYGAWDYLSMEDCLRHGRQAAAWALRRRT